MISFTSRRRNGKSPESSSALHRYMTQPNIRRCKPTHTRLEWQAYSKNRTKADTSRNILVVVGRMGGSQAVGETVRDASGTGMCSTCVPHVFQTDPMGTPVRLGYREVIQASQTAVESGASDPEEARGRRPIPVRLLQGPQQPLLLVGKCLRERRDGTLRDGGRQVF